MDDFAIGDTVEITGATMTGNVGAIVYLDSEREKYLVRVGGSTQNFFSADELRLFGS